MVGIISIISSLGGIFYSFTHIIIIYGCDYKHYIISGWNLLLIHTH